ncbi:RNA polymerase sigma factor [Prolixibacter sp. NT017]|uniref:RNA polymerase sigma factor n=1 Tax=Prolixibacter sp. NT017 TaxID=2652390 RepID=UPI001283BC5B|nr:sigma-70 family RNA polymerase sigma factor [Prolixibacter sp. NT017]GET25480.1 RNA polymerase sigma factor [Prolixibacter sp. NT017]
MKRKAINIHQHLIDRCLLNDAKAQFEIYKLYYKAMYNTSLRIVGNVEDAEDVMQEAFLKAFRKINSYEGEVSFGAWLKRIVINHSIDYLKKRKMVFNELSANENRLPDNGSEPEVEENISVDEIKKAMNELSHGYRLVLSLILFEGYDHEEVSEILGIKNATSRSQFLRARNKLKEILINRRSKNNVAII